MVMDVMGSGRSLSGACVVESGSRTCASRVLGTEVIIVLD